MNLSDPVKHRLVEGQVGEVIPAELLQRTAAFGDSAVGFVSAGHQTDWRGYAVHKGLEFATAGAIFVMPEGFDRPGRDALLVDVSEGHSTWQFGFTEKPTLQVDVRTAPDVEVHDYYIECTIAEPPRSYLHASAESDSAGSVPAWLNPVQLGDGKYRVYLGGIWATYVEKEWVYYVTPQLAELRRVILWGIQ